MTAIACTEVYVGGGVRHWRDASGQMIAGRGSSGFITDHRPRPPYFQILPCPYCGVEEDRGHEPLLHVDRRLGTPTRGDAS